MRIVGLVGVRQHPVGERRLDRAAQHVRARDRRHRRAAIAAREADRGAARSELRTGDHGGERVEHVVLGLLDHVGGQRPISRFGHIGAERSHHRPDRLRARRHAGGERGRDGGAAGLQHASPRHARITRMLVAVPGHIDAPCWHERSAVGTAAKSSTGAHRGPWLVDRAARRLRSRPAGVPMTHPDLAKAAVHVTADNVRELLMRSRQHPEPDRQRDRRRALSGRAHAQVGPGHRSAAGRRRAGRTRSGICAGAATGSISCSPATWTRPIRATRSISPATASSPRRSTVTAGCSGLGANNMKSGLAAALIAIEAIVKAGVELAGDISFGGVVGEIEKTAIEEFQGVEYSGYGIGTRHLVTHGVTADFALLAEPTGMRISIANMGCIWLRITVGGTVAHSALANRPNVVNAIAVMHELQNDIARWARDYEAAHVYMGEHPNVTIAAIRGGAPWRLSRNPHSCSLYLDIRTVPGQTVDGVKRDLRRVLRGFVEAHGHARARPARLCQRSADRGRRDAADHRGARRGADGGHRRAAAHDHPAARRRRRASHRLWRALRRLRPRRAHASGRARRFHACVRRARAGRATASPPRKSISPRPSTCAAARRHDAVLSKWKPPMTHTPALRPAPVRRTARPACSWPRGAWAQSYPNRPITFVVPFAPGGLSDVPGARAGAIMQERIGTSIVVENKPGASGVIGATHVLAGGARRLHAAGQCARRRAEPALHPGALRRGHGLRRDRQDHRRAAAGADHQRQAALQDARPS